ncbi:MAG: hypothetical protein LBF61_02010, partial [Azoarcus sp.]|nr:hypothetical protein [Azoarcus sp.]
QPNAALTWALPQQQPFRSDDGQKEIELLFLPDEDNGQKLVLYRVHENGHGQRKQKPFIPIEIFSLKRINLECLPLGARISLWGQNDLQALLQEQSEAQTLSLYDAASRFTVASVPDNGVEGWQYHPALGFAKKRM